MKKDTSKIVNYIIRIDEEFYQATVSLAEARRLVETLPIEQELKVIKIIKQVITDTVMNIYETKEQKTFIINELGE